MCSAAIFHSHVGRARFAARDWLMAGSERVPEINDWVATRWPERRGPEPGALGQFCGLLHLVWSIERSPDGVVARAFSRADPSLLERARHLVDREALTPLTSESPRTVYEALAVG